MYTYIYVCIYVWIYICIIYMHITYIYVWYIYIFVCLYTYALVYIHIYMHIYIHIYSHIHIEMYMHICFVKALMDILLLVIVVVACKTWLLYNPSCSTSRACVFHDLTSIRTFTFPCHWTGFSETDEHIQKVQDSKRR